MRQPAICGLFNIEKVQFYCLGIVPRVGLALFINMFPHDFLGHEWLIWCDDGENYLVGLIICPSWILPPFFSPSFLACCLAQVAPHPIVTATHTYLSVSDWSLWHTPVHSLRRRSVSPPFIGRVNGQEDSICLSFSCLFLLEPDCIWTIGVCS